MEICGDSDEDVEETIVPQVDGNPDQMDVEYDGVE